MTRLYRFLALTMVRTNFFPFAPLYRWGYHFAIKWLVHSLVRRHGVWITAIYLRRSLAMDAGVSGLSDIDLLVVLHDTVPAAQKREVVAQWDRLSRRFPFLDPHHEIFTVPELEEIVRVEPLFVFRIEEGRRAWRRLYGVDIFFRFPRITGGALVEGAWAELKLHWAFFQGLRAAPDNQDGYEKRKRAYLLFKCLTAFSRAQLEAQGQTYYSRPEVLAALRDRPLYADFPRLREFLEWGGAKQFRGKSFVPPTELYADAFAYLRTATQEIYRIHRHALANARHCQVSEFPTGATHETLYEGDLIFSLAPLEGHNFARAILLNDRNKAAGETLFSIAPDGSDFADGRADHPWRTLQHAVTLGVPGDRFWVAPGEYRGFSVVGPVAHHLHFSAAPGATIVEPGPGTPDGIRFEGANHITIEGFTVRGLRRGVFGLGCSHLTFRKNLFVDNVEAGVWLSGGAEGVHFEENHVTGTRRGSGLHVRGMGRDVTFIRNRCTNNAGAGIQINGDVSEGGTGTFRNVGIMGNELYGNGTRSASAIDCTGLLDSKVIGNRMVHYHRNGISLYRGDAGSGCLENGVRENLVVVGPYSAALEMREGSARNLIADNLFIALDGETEPIVKGEPDDLAPPYFSTNRCLRLNLREVHRPAVAPECYNFVDDPPQRDPEPRSSPLGARAILGDH